MIKIYDSFFEVEAESLNAKLENLLDERSVHKTIHDSYDFLLNK